MAQRVNVVVTDDFDGTEGASTLRFGLDGTEYEVDLSPEHEQQFRDFVQAYVNVGRKVAAGRRGVRKPSSGSKTKPSALHEIREWARAQGYDVGERGRIPQEIKDAYAASRAASSSAELTPEQLDSTPEFSQA